MYLLYCLYTAYIIRLYPPIDTWLHDLSMSLSSSLVLIIFLFYFIPPEFLAENDMFIYFELNFLIHFLRKLLQWRKEIRIVCPKVGTLILTAPSEIFSNATKTLIFWISVGCINSVESQICCANDHFKSNFQKIVKTYFTWRSSHIICCNSHLVILCGDS